MLNWLDGVQDEHIRDGAIELQSSIHTNMIARFATQDTAVEFMKSGRNAWRYLSLSKIPLVMNRAVEGTVLEIGAGSGWASAIMSQVQTVQKIYCLDYDPVSVEQLMPRVHRVLSPSPDKIERVLGSYNKMPLADEVDLIISIGALHHAESLHRVLEECHKVLKPGGWLFATEPVLPDTENNKSVYDRYKKEDPNSMLKYGRLALHEENSDHYYRISEFVAAAYAARYDVYPFIFDLDGSRHADDSVFRERKTATGFHPNILYPFYAPNVVAPEFDSLFLMLQKPLDGGIGVGHQISG